jgi:membrane-bound lytic murein transglycosylase D
VTLPAKVLRAAALVDNHDHRVLRSRVRVVVRRGDSLWAIARRHGVDVHALALLNGLQPGDPLRAGQRLKLVSARSGDDAAGTDASAPHTRRLTYTVRAGDTLSRIARVFQVSVAQLISWNSLEKTALAPGQRLLVRLVRP